MKFDRTFALRNDDAIGVATLDRRVADGAAIARFDFGAGAGALMQLHRLTAGLVAQREPGETVGDATAAGTAAVASPHELAIGDTLAVGTAAKVSTVGEPTQTLRVIDCGAGRGRGGMARVRVQIRDHGDHAAGFAMVGTTRT